MGTGVVPHVDTIFLLCLGLLLPLLLLFLPLILLPMLLLLLLLLVVICADHRLHPPHHVRHLVHPIGIHQPHGPPLPIPTEHPPVGIGQLDPVVVHGVVGGGDHDPDTLASGGAGAEGGEDSDAEEDGGQEGVGVAEPGGAVRVGGGGGEGMVVQEGG